MNGTARLSVGVLEAAVEDVVVEKGPKPFVVMFVGPDGQIHVVLLQKGLDGIPLGSEIFNQSEKGEIHHHSTYQTKNSATGESFESRAWRF